MCNQSYSNNIFQKALVNVLLFIVSSFHSHKAERTSAVAIHSLLEDVCSFCAFFHYCDLGSRISTANFSHFFSNSAYQYRFSHWSLAYSPQNVLWDNLIVPTGLPLDSPSVSSVGFLFMRKYSFTNKI